MMRKYISKLIIGSLILTACNKDWTEVESKAEEFQRIAQNDLEEKRDGFKWIAERERTQQNKEALEVYWEQLRDYKAKAWLNGGETVGQKPMYYFWYSGDTWKAQKGIAKSWLQALPDSLTCISMWGGVSFNAETISENQKKDLEIFHKKGGTVLMCWQTSAPGLGIPGSADGKVDGWKHFRNKYPYAEVEKTKSQWAAIYARDLARHIISLGLDGYDVDWETCGDHGKVTSEGHTFMIEKDGYKNIADFVKEIAKYFGPVGEKHFTKTQAEREENLEKLFDASTGGFHPNEKDFIERFKKHLPSDYKTKRYYLCADIPCGVAPIFNSNTFAEYFDKHFLQDYGEYGVGTHIRHLGGEYYNSTSGNYQSGGFQVMIPKARAVKVGRIWGLGAYHGQTDFDITNENAGFKKYLLENNLTRKYLNYAWTREAIRIADPRPSYANYKEIQPYIITP